MALTQIKSGAIADDAIDSSTFADGSIDNAHLAANSVDSDQYVDGSIDNAHLADDAVGVAELSATGTASATTFLRGDNAWAEAGGGKILQVVHVSTVTTSSIDSTTFTDCTNLTASITPASSSNKILAIAECVGICTESGDSSAATLQLLKNSTQVALTSNMGYSQSEQLNQSVTFVSLDDAENTNAHVYKVQMKNRTSGAVVLNNTTWSDYSSITLLEVAA